MWSGLIRKIINPLNLNVNPLNLHFRDKGFEKLFTVDYQKKNITLAFLFMLVGALLFSSFYLIYNMSHPGWFIVMIVFSVLSGFIIHYGLFRKYQIIALFIFSIIIEGSYNHRMLFYDGSDIGALAEYFMGLILIVLAVNIFLRLKFVYTVVLNLIFLLAFFSYSVWGIAINQINPEYFTYSMVVFFSTIVVICFSVYNNEYMVRYGFVQQTIIMQQADELRDEKENTEQKVIERTRELELEKQKSYKAILEGQQIERQRIAQDLHDSLNIQLIGVKRKLEIETSYMGIVSEIDGIIAQVREISHDLLPYSLKHFGLIRAISDLCISLGKQQPFQVSFSKIGIEENQRLDPVTETELYKIIQELAANIVKHAGATRVLIELIADEDMLYLTVEDNGVGFDVSEGEGHMFGLNNIEARLSVLGGTLSIDSRPGKGTTVMINLPIV